MATELTNTRSLPKPSFLKWIIQEESIIVEGIETNCYKLDFRTDDQVLDDWAIHVRRHYIRDDELDRVVALIKQPKDEYLQSVVIPSTPQIRAGDFAEIIISDLLQFISGYEVPRYKQHGRIDRNTSEHGTDVIAYRLSSTEEPSSDDNLMLIEVKSGASSNLKTALKRAADDSGKDHARAAMTLNYYMRRSMNCGDERTAKEVARFLDKGEHTYRETLAAAAVGGTEDAAKDLYDCTANSLGLVGYDKLFLIHKKKLMDLIHAVYDRCVN